MFGFFDLLIKRVSDQAAEYAAAQSSIAQRTWGERVDPFHVLQPAKVPLHRPARGRAPHRDPVNRRRSY